MYSANFVSDGRDYPGMLGKGVLINIVDGIKDSVDIQLVSTYLYYDILLWWFFWGWWMHNLTTWSFIDSYQPHVDRHEDVYTSQCIFERSIQLVVRIKRETWTCSFLSLRIRLVSHSYIHVFHFTDIHGVFHIIIIIQANITLINVPVHNQTCHITAFERGISLTSSTFRPITTRLFIQGLSNLCLYTLPTS